MKRSVILSLMMFWARPALARKIPASVEPPTALLACQVDADCAIVSNSCNGCCQQTAINRTGAHIFEKILVETCKGYRGPSCECVAEPATAICTKEQCAASIKN